MRHTANWMNTKTDRWGSPQYDWRQTPKKKEKVMYAEAETQTKNNTSKTNLLKNPSII